MGEGTWKGLVRGVIFASIDNVRSATEKEEENKEEKYEKRKNKRIITS